MNNTYIKLKMVFLLVEYCSKRYHKPTLRLFRKNLYTFGKDSGLSVDLCNIVILLSSIGLSTRLTIDN